MLVKAKDLRPGQLCWLPVVRFNNKDDLLTDPAFCMVVAVHVVGRLKEIMCTVLFEETITHTQPVLPDLNIKVLRTE